MFHCPPVFLKYWLEHFDAALEETDLGPRAPAIRRGIRAWAEGLGRSMINAKDGDPNPHGKRGAH